MAFNPEIHHRKSNRLSGFDYTQNGMYFVTICAFNRACIFGDIVKGETHLNAIGEIVAEEWVKTSAMRHNVELGEWVVMPNHLHAIVMIDDGNQNCRGDLRSPFYQCDYGAMPKHYLYSNKGDRQVAPTGPRTKSMGAIIAGFKSAVTKQVNILRQMPGLPLWQQNYHDHIIRDENDYNRICEYIRTNPLRWELDSLREGSI